MSLVIILCAVIAILIILLYYSTRRKNIDLTEQQNKLIELNKKIAESNATLSSLNHSMEDKAKDYWNTLVDSINKDKQKMIDDAIAEKQSYCNQIEQVKEELNSLQATRAATVEALRKEELQEEHEENLTLQLSAAEKADIKILKEIQTDMSKPRAISMLIWQTYYQPKAKELFSKLTGNNASGIYKITNIKTKECYIGRSTSIKNRWYEHCKCGLGIDTPANQKLYAAMLKYGLYNFSFEILEDNIPIQEQAEKEHFYIETFNSVNYGYNSLK